MAVMKRMVLKKDSPHKNDTNLFLNYINKFHNLEEVEKNLLKINKMVTIIYIGPVYLLENGDGIIGGVDLDVYLMGKFQFSYECSPLDKFNALDDFVNELSNDIGMDLKKEKIGFILRDVYEKNDSPIYNAMKNQSKEILENNLEWL